MGVFAIRQLLAALSPLIGFEVLQSRGVLPGELARATPDELQSWSVKGEEAAGEAVDQLFTSTLLDAWKDGWRARLGLRAPKEDDKSALIDPLVAVLEDLDFSTTLRKLVTFAERIEPAKGAEALKEAVQAFLGEWYDRERIPEYIRSPKEEQAQRWLETYAKRLKEEGRPAKQVSEEMRQVRLTHHPLTRVQKRSDGLGS